MRFSQSETNSSIFSQKKKKKLIVRWIFKASGFLINSLYLVQRSIEVNRKLSQQKKIYSKQTSGEKRMRSDRANTLDAIISANQTNREPEKFNHHISLFLLFLNSPSKTQHIKIETFIFPETHKTWEHNGDWNRVVETNRTSCGAI